MSSKLAIFPAAGGLGGATLSHLLGTCKFDPSLLVLVARSPSKLEEDRQRGVTVRKADFDEPASFEGVFEGVQVLNLISYPSFQHKHRIKVAKAAIDAAISQGVTHIFYSSLAFSSSTSPDKSPAFSPHVMLAHLDTEACLHSLAKASTPTSPFSYTVIRQGLYSESFPVYTANFDLGAASSSSEQDIRIRIPHNGGGPGIPWAKRDELGEATSRLLASYISNPKAFPHINESITLSGPKAYTLSETAEVFSRATGKTVNIEEVSVDEYVGKKGVGYGSTDTNQSTEMDRLWATAFEGVKRGEAATVTGDLQKWLGREPEAFEETIRGMLSR